MDGKQKISRTARRYTAAAFAPSTEFLSVEEPLEIRLAGRQFTITMRTPGNDVELVAGFLFAEGFISSAAEIGEIRPVIAADGKPEPNILDVILNVPAAVLRERLKRNFAINSSCGLCGRTTIEAISRRLAPITTTARVEASVLLGLGATMRAHQAVFSSTGGLHAAALFDFAGRLSVVREDIGRHNAVDKVVGSALNGTLPLSEHILMVSGRPSFELVQKAAAAGIPILAGVSAPSSLAAELSDQAGITLVGFLRNETFNVYAHVERICA